MNRNEYTPSNKDFKIVTNKYFFDHFRGILIEQLYKQADTYYGHNKWYAVEFTTSFLDEHWRDGEEAAHLDIIMRTNKGEKN